MGIGEGINIIHRISMLLMQFQRYSYHKLNFHIIPNILSFVKMSQCSISVHNLTTHAYAHTHLYTHFKVYIYSKIKSLTEVYCYFNCVALIWGTNRLDYDSSYFVTCFFTGT